MRILLIILAIVYASSLTAQSTVNAKNKKAYSKSFIDALAANKYSANYELSDSMLVAGGLDTFFFPTQLPLKRMLTFTGNKAGKEFILTLRRINYTTLDYHLKIRENNQLLLNEKGVATLGAGFFLGAETDEDDRTGSSYTAAEYYAPANCNLSIRVGSDNAISRIKIKRGCSLGLNVLLEDSPVLTMKSN